MKKLARWVPKLLSVAQKQEQVDSSGDFLKLLLLCLPIPFFYLLGEPDSHARGANTHPSTLVLGLLSTVLPLLLHPTQGTPQIKLHIYIDNINNISRLA